MWGGVEPHLFISHFPFIVTHIQQLLLFFSWSQHVKLHYVVDAVEIGDYWFGYLDLDLFPGEYGRGTIRRGPRATRPQDFTCGSSESETLVVFL